MTNNDTKFIIGLLSLIALILALVLGWGIYIVWQNNHQVAAQLDKANATTEADILAQSIKTMQNASALELSSFEQFVLSDATLVSFIEKIEEAGHTFKIETNIASVNKIEDKKSKPNDPRLIRLTIETGGSWAGTISFLEALESLPYRVMIEETTLTKQEDRWHARIVLSLNSFD